MKNLLLTLFFSFLAISTFATTVEWINTTGNWNVASNWSTGSVPTVNDHVIIPSGGEPTVPSGYNARTKTVYVEPNASITINQNGRLRSIGNSSNSSGIVNDGSIYNSGLLLVRDLNTSQGVDIYSGLENNGLLVNNSKGVIRIKRIEGTGIYNNVIGTFSNFGTIEVIEGIEGEGLINQHLFYNHGLITISNTLQTGIINNNTFYNSYTISISNSDLLGFENYGVFENPFKSILQISNNFDRGYVSYSGSSTYNDGEIFIDNIWGFNAYAFMTFGPFDNDINGKVEVELSSFGIYIAETCYNDGKLEAKNGISEIGITATGQLINRPNGSLISSDCGFRNVYASTPGLIDNYGLIEVSDAPGSAGVAVHGELNNYITGTIEITGTDIGIINFNDFNNHGTINLGENITTQSLSDGGSFTNESSGTIVIRDFTGMGLYINSSGITVNDGIIEIDSDIGNYGAYLIGELTNGSNGEIQIIRTQNYGISLQSTGNLINRGYLEISPRSSSATGLYAYGSVRNEGDAYLYIHGLTGTGKSIFTYLSFINQDNAEIVLTSTNSAYYNGIANYGSFENIDCASITYHQRINNQGDFLNTAWMEDHYTSVHTNAGDLINQGIIQDHEPSFQNINVDNEGAIIEAIQGPISAGDIVQNALNVGPNTPNYIKIKSFFTDANSNDFAGYYDIYNNIFGSENNTQGLSTLYVKVDNMPGGCQGFVPIPIIGGIHLVDVPDSNTSEQHNLDKRQAPSLSTSIFPNPSSGDFYLNGDFPTGVYQILIYNPLGKKVWEQEVNLDSNPIQIQLEKGLPNGMYFLQVRQENTLISNQKIQLQNIR